MTPDLETRKSSEPVKPSLARLVVAVAISTVSLAGCTTETGGLPTPGNTQPTPNTGRPTIPGGGTSSSSTPTSTRTADSSLRNTDPCSLLSTADMSALSLLKGEVTAGSREDDKGCRWHSTREGDYSIQVDVYALLGTKEVRATGEIKPIGKVGTHQAVQYVFGTTCSVSLGITETSRVDVRVGAGGNNQKACEMAPQVARLVEPKLPASS
jgi:hypothetical protein